MPKIGYKQTEKHKEKVAKLITKVPPKKLILDENLGYILGTLKGDGYVGKYSKSGVYIIGLEVVDKDFALYFKKVLDEWTGFEAIIKYYPKKSNSYRVWLYSKFVVDYLKNFDIEKIKTASKKIKRMFLRGFYDSEGCVPKDVKAKFISISNQSRQLLQFCKDLLSNLGMESRPIRIQSKKGDRTNFGVYSENHYELNIGNKENLIKFRDLVGFNIKRKQNNLIKMIDSYLTEEQLFFIKFLSPQKKKNWKKLYNKKHKNEKRLT